MQKKNLVFFGVVFFSIFFSLRYAKAAPVISSVSGAFDHKATIVVNGSGFGAKATGPPVIWDDASTGTLLTDNGKWSGAWPNRGSDMSYITQYHTPFRGVALPHGHDTRYIAGAHGLANEGYDAGYNVMFWKTVNLTSYPFQMYASWYQRYDPAALPLRTDWNLKYFDWSYGGEPYKMGSCLQNNWYINYAPTGVALSATTGSVQHQMNDDTWGSCSPGSLQNPDVNGHGVYWLSGKNPFNYWMKYEIEAVMTNQNTGHVKMWEDGVLKINYVGRTDAWTLGDRSIGIGGYSRNYGPNHWRYFADIYLDYSLQRIVLANSANLSNATIVENQIPSRWNDGSLSVTANLGQFQSGQTAYLYVVDVTGAVNPNGYPVTIGSGGGGDTTPPTSPANLAANATSQSSITVTWNPATDNVGVTGYIVERCQGSGCSNFTQVGTPTASPFVDTGLTANTFYNYHARATDAAGNLSGWSNVVGATTQGTTSGATRVFYDGSESGNVNLWAASDGTRSPCQSVVSALDGGGPAVGSRMLRCNWNGVVPWNDYNSYDTLQLNSWNYTNEMLMRFWIRLDQDMDYKDGAKLFRLGFGGDSDTFWQRDPVSQSGGTHEAWYVNGNAIINAWGAHNFEDHQWHKIEIYIKSDTGPNGAIKVWMDNALTNSYQYPYTGITAVGSSRWYPFNLMSNWSSNPGWEHDANNHVYWDDIEIYTDSSSGTPATGSLSNASIQANGGGTPTPTFTLSANPTSITSGASSTLTWSAVTNATSCTASGGTFTGSKPTSGGTQSVSPTSTTTYTLSCTGAGGTTNQSATVTVTNPTERIIDNTDSTVSQSGAWSPSTNFPGYYGANYHYSPNQSGEWFEWQATGLTAGTYQVFAYWNANADRPTDVSYRITHSGGATTINNINQTQSGSQWNLLGTYTFGTTGTVRVISGATGTEGTVADAVRFVRTNTIPCNTVTTANFSQAAYNSYGAPFDAFQTSTNLMNANCSSSDPHTIQATLGQMGDTTRIVYTKGYYYTGSAWTQYSGTCTGALNGEWCQGSVSATITNPNISTASASAAAYFVGMTCSVQSGGWKCGCRDTTCSNFYWQIQGAGQ
jgi:hypothetical protein